MSDPEFRDPELAARLSRLAPPPPSAEPAYALVRRNVTRAKRRRAAVVGAGGCAAILAVGALALRDGGPNRRIDVTGPAVADSTPIADPATSIAGTVVGTTVPAGPSTTIADPATSTTAGNGGSAVPTAKGPVEGAGTPPVTGETSGGSTGSVAGQPSSTARPPSTQPHSTSNSAAPTTAAPAPSTSAAVERTCSSPGGSIRVRLNGAAVQLVSHTTAAGFEYELRDQRSDRIIVSFNGETVEYRITATPSGGSISCQVEQSGHDGGEEGGSSTIPEPGED